jgi:diacylglycerol kinase
MKLLRSFIYAWHGLKICFTAEVNFRIHIVCAIAAIFLGCMLRLSSVEWIAVTGCIAFVITMEMINTAIEELCDVVQGDIHPGIKKVKDIAAGAVMMAAIASLIIGFIIFLPKIIVFIKSV